MVCPKNNCGLSIGEKYNEVGIRELYLKKYFEHNKSSTPWLDSTSYSTQTLTSLNRWTNDIVIVTDARWMEKKCFYVLGEAYIKQLTCTGYRL